MMKTRDRSTATRKMLNKPPLPFTKGLRLGNMPQIRVIVDEELESVWTGKKTPQQALDTAVERGNQLLRRFEKSTSLNQCNVDAFRLSDLASRVGRISEAHPAQFRNLTVMSSSVRCSARAGCLICWSRRSSSSPLSFLSACGRSVVVLATKRRSIWFLQPVCRPG